MNYLTSIIVQGQLDSHLERIKLEPYLILHIHSKWTEDLNMKTKTIQVLEETTGEILYNFRIENVFLITIWNIRQYKRKTDK